MLRLCANISMLYQEVSFLERYQWASQDGFALVECLFPYEYKAQDIKAVCEDAKVNQQLFNAYPGDWQAGERGLACLPERRQDFRDSIELALAYAHCLNTGLVHVMAGIVPESMTVAEAESIYVENLQWAARVAKNAGVVLTVEAINPMDMPDYLVSTQEQADRLCQQIGNDAVKLQFDVYHCQKYQGDVIVRLNALKTDIVHIQIAGIPDRHEPDVGDFDYRPIFEELRQMNYTGAIGCEYRPQASTRDGLGWRALVASADNCGFKG